MNLKIKTKIAVTLLITVFSCKKENLKTSTAQSSAINNAVTSFTIGQAYHGGIIFYIDNTGKHGLIAAASDQATNIAWRAKKDIVTGATGTAVGTGADNTQKIIAAQGKKVSYAALLCDTFTSGKFKDWYLPSKDELNLLYAQRNAVGGLSTSNYWSSSEGSAGKAWDQEFGGGFQFKDRKSFTLGVRAISSF